MEILGKLFGGAVGTVWMLAGPITYILNVVDTWGTRMPALGKIAMNLTLDAILAVVWPITWAIWLIQYATGSYTTPLTTVLGF